jgi:hypothetical protein
MRGRAVTHTLDMLSDKTVSEMGAYLSQFAGLDTEVMFIIVSETV